MSIASALFDVVKRKGLSLSPLHKKGKANNDVFSAELRKKERGNRPWVAKCWSATSDDVIFVVAKLQRPVEPHGDRDGSLARPL